VPAREDLARPYAFPKFYRIKAMTKYSRKFPRRRFKQDVGLLHKGGYAVVGGLEIGEGGMLVRFPDSVQIGDVVGLSFFIPLKGFVSVVGEVVYQRPELNTSIDENTGTLGVKFMDLEFESKRFIRDFIALKTAEEAFLENPRI
jgi:hypothetical protein